MGFFDNSTGGNMGFASVENTANFTNEDLLAKLSEVKVSFGTPVMGDIMGTQSVMYKNVTDRFDIFVRVHRKKIIMGKIGATGVSSLSTANSMGMDLVLGTKEEGTSTADRAVDELLGVIKRLEAGEVVTESETPEIKTATGEAIALYMRQKVITLKPKFDIFNREEETVYHVEGDITKLNFSIQKNGSEVLKLKKKLIALMPEYTIEKGGREIAKIKKKFKLVKPELNGNVEGRELKISGDIMGFDFDIVVGGKTIGHVDTDFDYWADCYRITIFDESMSDVVIALAIICDGVHDSEKSSD